MELFEVRQLVAFKELAKCLSFTEAATHLHLTQSAISHSIKALERQLDVSLFERLGKTVNISPAGEILLPYVDRILSEMQAAQCSLMSTLRPGYGRLRIGATVSICQAVLPQILRELSESFPGFEFSVTTEGTRELVSLLEHGELDMAIGLENGGTNRLKFTELFTDEILMAFSPIHPMARTPDMVEADLVEERFVYYQHSGETLRMLEQIFGDARSRLRASTRVSNMGVVKEMAQVGMGIGMLPPWLALDEIRRGSLVFRRFPSDEAKRVWGVFEPAKAQDDLVRQVFRGVAREVVKSLDIQTEAALNRSTMAGGD